jgi:hypothetical protein
MIRLNGKYFQKHRIVMEQFNPSTDETKCIVYRKNGDKNDCHLENLVWLSRTDLSKKQTHSSDGELIEYLDKLPEGSIPLVYYKKEIEDFSNHEEDFFCWNGERFKKLVPRGGIVTFHNSRSFEFSFSVNVYRRGLIE